MSASMTTRSLIGRKWMVHLVYFRISCTSPTRCGHLFSCYLSVYPSLEVIPSPPFGIRKAEVEPPHDQELGVIANKSPKPESHSSWHLISVYINSGGQVIPLPIIVFLMIFLWETKKQPNTAKSSSLQERSQYWWYSTPKIIRDGSLFQIVKEVQMFLKLKSEEVPLPNLIFPFGV